MNRPLTLKDNDTVVIIGAGPAGSFFAIHLLMLAKKMGIRINVIMFDRKFFTEHGPPGCNMCAGAIGNNLVKKLNEMNIPLPESVVRQEVDGYSLHGRIGYSYIKTEPGMKIYTVFRGAGPCASEVRKYAFDQYLLDTAINLGARFKNELVEDIFFPEPGSGEKIRVKIKGEHEYFQADLVVGAFGVNTAIVKKIKYGYVPPKTWHSCQGEIRVSEDFYTRKHSKFIHVFLTNNPLIKFSAITPKGEFLTVTSIGEHVKIKDMENEMRTNPEIRMYLSADWKITCHCHPQLPVSSAKRPYADRFVVVGDACISRFLKNGIESAFYTSKFAAKTALMRGISSNDFEKYYYRECMRMFEFDNLCGRILFRLYDIASSSDAISHVYLSMVKKEQKGSDPDRRLSRILWNMFTGDAPYKEILYDAMSLKLIFKLIFRGLRGISKK